MKQTKTSSTGDLIGFITTMLMFLYVISNYEEFLAHEIKPGSGTGARFFSALVKFFDSYGGKPSVYLLFVLLGGFFLYHFIKGIKNSKTGKD